MPTLIYGATNAAEVLSIIVVSKVQSSLLLNITILREINNVPVTGFLANKIPIIGYGKQEIINLCVNNEGLSFTPTILYLDSGDTLFANSDFSGNMFDCWVNGKLYQEL